MKEIAVIIVMRRQLYNTHAKRLLFEMVCDASGDLAPFAQFKKREKRPWRSVTFSK